MAFTTIEWAIAIAHLVGSLSSAIGSGFIVATYLILPLKRHFRHSLILNLAIADFISSVNNSVSGLWRLINGTEIQAGPGCVANGFIEQISVQGTDTSIFAIAVVTVWALTRKTLVREMLPRTTTFLMCAATWVLPFINATAILAMDRYVPVSGNWCWITPKPVYFRYVMMHGWRFAFILCEIGLYTYLHLYIRQRFKDVRNSSRMNDDGDGSRVVIRSDSELKDPARSEGMNECQDIELDAEQGTGGPEILATDDTDLEDDDSIQKHVVATSISPVIEAPSSSTSTSPRSKSSRLSRIRWHFAHPFAHRSAEDDDLSDCEGNQKQAKNTEASRSRRVRRILLLNAYPAMYILLWIPGIANRFVEASGNRSNVTALLQASTQFIGLANAVTYGWNERVGTQLRSRISNIGRGIREISR